MIYRTLGRTGLKVSQLGFGAMRLPMKGEGGDAVVDRDKSTPMILKAFENGVNYIDSAVGYCNADSQRAVGDALKAWGKRDEIVVSTKNHDYSCDEKQWWKNLEDSLERLGVDCIDIYNHHGLSWQAWTEKVEPVIGNWMRKARDQGLIRHICCSTHDSCENVIKLIDSGYPAVITLQYNLLDRHLEDAIAHAGEKGVGIVVMGPVAGGRLGATSDVLTELVPGIDRVPELALRFVLSNPDVSVALSGMSTMEHVEENLAVASDATGLGDEEKQAIDEHMQRLGKMAELYCTGCGYCMPCEAAGVNIPRVFSVFNQGRVYGLWDVAKKGYAGIRRGKDESKNKTAEACVECGVCEDKCPQDIPIRKQLKEAHEALGDSGE